jgi:hypothetical protein
MVKDWMASCFYHVKVEEGRGLQMVDTKDESYVQNSGDMVGSSAESPTTKRLSTLL